MDTIFYDCSFEKNNLFCVYKLPKDVNIKIGKVVEVEKVVATGTEKLYGVC
ncbi:MAG: hypothetical protein ACTSW1_00610 [Candidatus Hodarchaeales archaeon]